MYFSGRLLQNWPINSVLRSATCCPLPSDDLLKIIFFWFWLLSILNFSIATSMWSRRRTYSLPRSRQSVAEVRLIQGTVGSVGVRVDTRHSTRRWRSAMIRNNITFCSIKFLIAPSVVFSTAVSHILFYILYSIAFYIVFIINGIMNYES